MAVEKKDDKEKTKLGTMIFGLTMQEHLPVVPKVVADWLRNGIAKYGVDFRVDVRDTYDHELVRKFDRIFFFSRGREHGVGSVAFLYPEEWWYVKIVGGLDSNGQIVGHVDSVVEALPATLRNEISGLSEQKPEDLDDIDETSIGLLRRGPVVSVKDGAHEMLEPDLRWTSELTLSGDEWHDLLNDPARAREATEAIYAKDWAKLAELAGKKPN